MASSADSRAARAAPAFAIEPMSAATRLALDVCCRHDRDAVLEELRATIAAQADEIRALRRGVGVRMGPLWTAFFEAEGMRPDPYFTEMKLSLRTVMRFVHHWVLSFKEEYPDIHCIYDDDDSGDL